MTFPSTGKVVLTGDVVVEVGPGLGILTRELIARVGAEGRVVAVETLIAPPVLLALPARGAPPQARPRSPASESSAVRKRRPSRSMALHSSTMTIPTRWRCSASPTLPSVRRPCVCSTSA